MTTYKLMCWLFLGVLFLAGVVTPQNDTDNTTFSTFTDETTHFTVPENNGTSEAPVTGTTETDAPANVTSGNGTFSTVEPAPSNTTDEPYWSSDVPQNFSTAEPPTQMPTTTEHATVTTAVPTPCTPGQHFDVASFIGGIVLALGLIAIAFFGYKFYKSKTNHRYSQF